jgi:hypothetical protein
MPAFSLNGTITYGTSTQYTVYQHGIQYIIDNAQQIEIDRRRMVGQTVSRSQRIKTAERSTAQPWKFRVTPPAQIPWTTGRVVAEAISAGDRVAEYEISLNNSSGMNYITAYQGGMTAPQRAALTISSTGTSTLTLTNLPSVSTTTVLFAAGDIIQPANSRYPYAVTDTIVRGASTTTNVTLNRPLITSEGISLIGQTLLIGNSCTWQVVLTIIPTYTLIYGQRMQYNGDFELIEKII